MVPHPLESCFPWTPPPLTPWKLWPLNPPPPWNFQGSSVEGIGYFLEPHILTCVKLYLLMSNFSPFTTSWGYPDFVLRNQCLVTSTKWCCVHTLSTQYVTVYIVTPFRLVRLPFWNMSLGVRTKQLTAWNLQKLCADRDPVPTFVPKNKVEL